MATVTASTTPTTEGMDQRRRSARFQRRLLRVLLTLLAVVVAVAFLLPVIWMLLGSLRPGNEVIEQIQPLGWNTLVPSEWTLDNYVQLFQSLGFGQNMINSLLVAFASVAIGLALSAPAAYALSVFRFPGRELIFTVLVIAFMIPFEAIAIPLAQIFTDLGLNNTYLGLILPGIGNGMAVFNMRQSFLGVPQSLREAAIIDGASDFRVLSRIYLPLNGTALINSGLLIFLAQWSSYLWPLLVISDEVKQVAPIALSKTYTSTDFNFGQLFGGTLLLSLVPAVLLLVLQRFFAKSIATTGEK